MQSTSGINFVFLFFPSVFDGLPIPYPKREFISDDDNEDKADTASKAQVRGLTNKVMYENKVWENDCNCTCVCLLHLDLVKSTIIQEW